MTTPPRAVSIVAILAATVFGVVLMVGALGIPVPTVRIDVEVGPPADVAQPVVSSEEATTASFEEIPAPPPPPPAPPPPSADLDHRAVINREGFVRLSDGQAVPLRVIDVVNAQNANVQQQVPEPAFTPMTVRPQLANMAEVQQALIREYPAALRDAGIGGASVIWVYIDTNGVVASTQVFESSGQAALDAAAQNVGRAMRFSPAYNGDSVVPVWVQIPVRFAVVN